MTVLRQLKQDDANHYLEMLNQLDTETQLMMYEVGERPQSIEQLKAYLSNERVWVYGVVEKEKIIGFVSLEKGLFERTAHCGYIVLGILRCAQNQGYGQLLLETAIATAKQNQLSRLELTVMKHNEQAVKLYKKVGFHIEGERKHSICIDGKYIDEWAMSYMIGEKHNV